uniref:Uncharacterized protein n=1 Tax=Magnetococcus massalia (strain MO-1) TaxID=451514 RepID=A0A1S7LLA1_MAGMO|nr:protein of unknown function [Candidatus Magnetococcus massalia]
MNGEIVLPQIFPLDHKTTQWIHGQTKAMPLSEALYQFQQVAPSLPRHFQLGLWAQEQLGLSGAALDRWHSHLWCGSLANIGLISRAQEQRMAEVEPLLEPTDWSLLAPHREKGEGVILVGGHVGPSLLNQYRILKDELPILVFATNNSLGDVNLVNLNRKHLRNRSLALAVSYLRKGGSVHFSPDGLLGQSWVEETLLGCSIRLSKSIFQIEKLTRAPIYWLSAQWQKGRIAHLLRPMPSLRDTPAEQWQELWTQAYLAMIAEAYTQGAENIRFGGSFATNWQA